MYFQLRSSPDRYALRCLHVASGVPIVSRHLQAQVHVFPRTRFSVTGRYRHRLLYILDLAHKRSMSASLMLALGAARLAARGSVLIQSSASRGDAPAQTWNCRRSARLRLSLATSYQMHSRPLRLTRVSTIQGRLTTRQKSTPSAASAHMAMDMSAGNRYWPTSSSLSGHSRLTRCTPLRWPWELGAGAMPCRCRAPVVAVGGGCTSTPTPAPFPREKRRWLRFVTACVSQRKDKARSRAMRDWLRAPCCCSSGLRHGCYRERVTTGVPSENFSKFPGGG